MSDKITINSSSLKSDSACSISSKFCAPNSAEWKNLCSKFNLNDEELLECLLTLFKTTLPKSDTLKFEDVTSLLYRNELLLSCLNGQRQMQSSFCDFHFKVPGLPKDLYLSAHRCVLASFLGETFFQKLNCFRSHPLTSSSNTLFDSVDNCLQVDGISVVLAPSGFENLVEFCYTGELVSSTNDHVKHDSLKEVIETMVDEPEIKQMIFTKLSKIVDDDLAKLGSSAKPTQPPEQVDTSKMDNNENDQTDLDIANNSESIQLLDNLDADSKVSSSLNLTTEIDNNSDIELSDDKSSEELSVEISTIQTDNSSQDDLNAVSTSCDKCDESFPTRAQLLKHVRFEHSQLLPSRTRTSKRKAALKGMSFLKMKRIASGKERRKPIGVCCGEEYFNKFKFGVHIFYNHSVVFATCSECTELVVLTELVEHYKTFHNYGVFPENQAISVSTDNSLLSDSCEVDQQGSTTPGYMLEVPRATSAKSLSDVSASTNSNYANFSSQLQSQQAGNLWFKHVNCVGCNNKMPTFEYVTHLNEQHHSALQTLHSKSLNLHKTHRCLLFQCQLCQSLRKVPEKAIRLYLLLTKHISRYHEAGSTGDEKVNCDICGNLVVKFYLDNHRKSHLLEQSSDAQMVPCDICGKDIKKKRISVHRRTHFEKFPCKYCAKTFNRKENLRVHERIHTGEKPFVCDICGKGFRQYVELRLHNRKHEKEIPQLLQDSDKYLSVYLPPISR